MDINQCILHHFSSYSKISIDDRNFLDGTGKTRRVLPLEPTGAPVGCTELDSVPYTKNVNFKQICQEILNDFIRLSNSQYGYIATKKRDEDPYLEFNAYKIDHYKQDTHRILENKDTLYGIAMVKKEILISNDVMNDNRRGGQCKLPKEHPKLDNYISIPLTFKEEYIGQIGLANRKEGYDMELVKMLEPLTLTMSHIMGGHLENQKILKELEKEKNRQLQLLKQVSKTKDGFLASMSHEIRTPLNGIIGMTDVLYRTKIDNTQKEYINIIKNCGNQLLELINDILDFSKLIAGKTVLQKEKFKLRCCIEESYDTISIKADKKKIDISFVIHPEVPNFIIGDKKRLRQVLVNILSNAVKFTDSGTIITKVNSQKLENNLYDITFSITDTGIGIPEDKQSSIFDMFTQIHNSNREGTGLGLSISKHLISSMNGNISVQSQLDKGSTFTFNVVVEGNNDPIVTRNIDVLKNKQVLLVDDTANNRIIYFNILNDWGMNVHICSSSEEAQLYIDNYNYDIILLDIHMPKINGIELAEIIKQKYPKIFIIALSSLSEIIDTSNIFDRKLIKPVKHEKLLNTLLSLYNNVPTLGNSTHSNRLELNILVAEDNNYNRTVIQELLLLCGINSNNITMAENGEKVVELLEAGYEFDILYLDIKMPKMNGYEVIDYMKNNNISIYTIALTAHALDQEKNKCMKEYNMDDFICKPITLQNIRQTITKYQSLL